MAKKRKSIKKVNVQVDEILTESQENILRRQIRRNSFVIDAILKKIDLLANRERCPKDANTLLRFRKQLSIEVEENDNFRNVLSKHLRLKERWKQIPDDLPDPITYLVNQIKCREKSLIAQACMK